MNDHITPDTPGPGERTASISATASATNASEPGREIAQLLPAVIGVLVFVAVIPVIALGFIGAKDNTSRLLRDHNEQVLQSVLDKIDGVLMPVEAQLRHIQREVAAGRIEVTVEPGTPFEAFVLGSLAATPQVSGYGLVRNDLFVRLFNRENGLAFDADINNLHTALESLHAGRQIDAPIWMSVVWSGVLSQPILRLVAPLRTVNGDFYGILVAVVTTRELSVYLRDLSENLGATTAYILVGEDRVLAHPSMIFERVNINTDDPLPRLGDIGDPVLPFVRATEKFELTAVAPLRRAQGHWTWVNGAGHVFVYDTVYRYGNVPWTVGIHVPGEESQRSRWIVNGIAVGGVVFLLIALVISRAVGKRIAQPVLKLASAAQSIAAYDFDKARKLPRGPIYEVNVAAAAFERTAAGMSLFESYVPTAVARDLLDHDGNSPTEEREGTVLFVDLVGFTTIAEVLPANEVVEMLNEYFDAVAGILSRHHGVITQFQGDAVLATFNLPVTLDDHATEAVEAAQEIIALADSRTFAGQDLDVRVGVNTGRMIGGSVGAKGRLNYTVHGDAVNTAARLESLNKEYGTTLLVSEATVEHAGLRDTARRVGDTRIRGKLKPVTLYTFD